MRNALCLATLALGCLVGAARPALADPLVPVAAEAQREPSNHALALRARWLTVPGWSLSPYLSEHTQLDNGWSVGLEYLYRHPGFDVVVSVDYSSLQAADGNFRGKGASDQIHFLHFDGLSALSADVSLIGHWNLTSWLEIRFGGGLGLGGVFGDIYQITNDSSSAGCKAEPGNPDKCRPRGVSSLEPAYLSQNHACPGGDGGRDTEVSPCYRKTDTYPLNVRVVPVINTLLGLRFRAQKHVYVHLEAGWRLVGFYLGAGPEFRF